MPDQEQITIKSVSVEDNLFLTVEYTQQEPEKVLTIKESSTSPAHEDLLAALETLDVHLSAICEQYCDGKKKGTFLDDSINCIGFKMAGKLDNEAIILIGTRKLSNGQTIDLKSPYTKFADKNNYKKIDDLYFAYQELLKEVMLYLFENKKAPDTQGSLFEEEQE